MSMWTDRRDVLRLLTALMALPALTSLRASAANSKRIGVVGAGSLGGTVGGLWARAGHEVMFSSRHPEELVSMTRELGPRASTGTSKEAAAFGEFVLFAVPYEALRTLGREFKADLRDKIVLDACNPSASISRRWRVRRRAMVWRCRRSCCRARDSCAPSARWMQPLLRLHSVDRTTNFSVPIAGDDSRAVETAAQLVRDAGCEPVVVGNLAAAAKFQRGQPAFRANTTGCRTASAPWHSHCALIALYFSDRPRRVARKRRGTGRQLAPKTLH